MKLLGGVLLSLVAPVVVAEGIERQLESHEHGKADMAVVLEGSELQIEISSPAANIVGFEHAPVDEQQQQALTSVIAQLKQPERLFVFPEGSACNTVLAEVETTLVDSHDEHEHEHENEHEAGHDHEGDREGSDHSDFMLSYQFHCGSAELLNGFSLELFQYYPQMKHLQVQLIGPAGQSYQQLDSENRWVSF